MGRWFVEFLASQGFAVEVADPSGAPAGFPQWRTGARPISRTTSSCCATPLGVTDAILRDLALRRPPGVIFDVGSLKSPAARRAHRAEIARRAGHLGAPDVRARHRAALRPPRDFRRPGPCRGAGDGARAVRPHHGGAGGDEPRRARPPHRLRARPVARAEHRVLHRAGRKRRGGAAAGEARRAPHSIRSSTWRRAWRRRARSCTTRSRA